MVQAVCKVAFCLWWVSHLMCGELHVASRLQAPCITAWKQQSRKHVECLARGRMLRECCNTRSTSVLLLSLLWFAACAVLLFILLCQ